MASSPWTPTAGSPPPPQAALAAAQEPVEGSRSLPAKEEGSVAGGQETSGRITPEDYHSYLMSKEHKEKINRYQAMLAARLKAKYFPTKTLEEGDVVEEIVIQSETIQLSRWPFTRLFADPGIVYRERSHTEKDISPSMAVEAMPKN